MVTPAIDNIINYYNDIEITFIGSQVSIAIIKNHPKAIKSIVLNKKYESIYQICRQLGEFDIYFTFRSSLRSKLVKFFINAKNKYQFNYKKYKNRHQVEKYVDFVNQSLNINSYAGPLNINNVSTKDNKVRKTIGINPGASYGSAKRWYPDQFSKIAIKLSNKFDIIIFGGVNEQAFANKIESLLKKNNIHNYRNLAGKTSIPELINCISELDIFITGDSGPMHLAASLQVPTIAIFGPSNDKETSQWKNNQSMIIKKNLECQPCMKRSCPLKHHNCMKLIKAQEVIDSIPIVLKSLT